MKKISSLFARNAEGNVTRDYHPLAHWVVDGEFWRATREFDGTACRWADGQLWARYDAKRGKVPPARFAPCQEPDPVTGHWPGWVPATGPEHKWIREAWANSGRSELDEWTYEAIGPKIGANPEKLERHIVVPHGQVDLLGAPTSWDGLVEYFRRWPFEGIVWWRTSDLNCDKVKITANAVGVKWGGRA